MGRVLGTSKRPDRIPSVLQKLGVSKRDSPSAIEAQAL
jgi:hypothetical protein